MPSGGKALSSEKSKDAPCSPCCGATADESPPMLPVSKSMYTGDVMKPTQGTLPSSKAGFLVSFLVDARGGAMTGHRHWGMRVIIPPAAVQQPTRINCRYQQLSNLPFPPPFMEREALASRVIEVNPGGERFHAPVLIEIPHFASNAGAEREMIVLRSDDGETWYEHVSDEVENGEIYQDVVTSVVMKDSDLERIYDVLEVTKGRIIRILTSKFPKYFAVLTRVREEVKSVGPDGGKVVLLHEPRLRATFPKNALYKKIKVGLQVQSLKPELVQAAFGRSVEVSKMIAVEPRKRKFHQPIFVSIPLPCNPSKINPSTSIRLLCSVTGATDKAVWQDLTGTTPLELCKDVVHFSTKVSAIFWILVIHDKQRDSESALMAASKLYEESILIPYLARFSIFYRENFPRAWVNTIRIYCMTDDKAEKAIKSLPGFRPLAISGDVEVPHTSSISVKLSGNILQLRQDPFTGELLAVSSRGSSEVKEPFVFKAFEDNSMTILVQAKDPEKPISGCLSFGRRLTNISSTQQLPLCEIRFDVSGGDTSFVIKEDMMFETIDASLNGHDIEPPSVDNQWNNLKKIEEEDPYEKIEVKKNKEGVSEIKPTVKQEIQIKEKGIDKAKDDFKKHTEAESKTTKEVYSEKEFQKEEKNEIDIKERKTIEVVSKDMTQASKEDTRKQKEAKKKTQNDETIKQKVKEEGKCKESTETHSTQDAAQNKVEKTKKTSKQKGKVSNEIDMKKLNCVHDVTLSSPCKPCDDNQKTFERCASIKPDISKDDRKEKPKQSGTKENRPMEGSNVPEIKSTQGTRDKPKIDMNSQICIHDISLKEMCTPCDDNMKSLDRRAIKKGTEKLKPENTMVLNTKCDSTAKKEQLTQPSSEQDEKTFSIKKDTDEQQQETEDNVNITNEISPTNNIGDSLPQKNDASKIKVNENNYSNEKEQLKQPEISIEVQKSELLSNEIEREDTSETLSKDKVMDAKDQNTVQENKHAYESLNEEQNVQIDKDSHPQQQQANKEAIVTEMGDETDRNEKNKGESKDPKVDIEKNVKKNMLIESKDNKSETQIKESKKKRDQSRSKKKTQEFSQSELDAFRNQYALKQGVKEVKNGTDFIAHQTEKTNQRENNHNIISSEQNPIIPTNDSRTEKRDNPLLKEQDCIHDISIRDFCQPCDDSQSHSTLKEFVPKKEERKKKIEKPKEKPQDESLYEPIGQENPAIASRSSKDKDSEMKLEEENAVPVIMEKGTDDNDKKVTLEIEQKEFDNSTQEGHLSSGGISSLADDFKDFSSLKREKKSLNTSKEKTQKEVFDKDTDDLNFENMRFERNDDMIGFDIEMKNDSSNPFVSEDEFEEIQGSDIGKADTSKTNSAVTSPPPLPARRKHSSTNSQNMNNSRPSQKEKKTSFIKEWQKDLKEFFSLGKKKKRDTSSSRASTSQQSDNDSRHVDFSRYEKDEGARTELQEGYSAKNLDGFSSSSETEKKESDSKTSEGMKERSLSKEDVYGSSKDSNLPAVDSQEVCPKENKKLVETECNNGAEKQRDESMERRKKKRRDRRKTNSESSCTKVEIPSMNLCNEGSISQEHQDTKDSSVSRASNEDSMESKKKSLAPLEIQNDSSQNVQMRNQNKNSKSSKTVSEKKVEENKGSKPKVIVPSPQGIPRPKPISKKESNRDSIISDDGFFLEETIKSERTGSLEDSEEFKKAVESFDQIYLLESGGIQSETNRASGVVNKTSKSNENQKSNISPNVAWKKIKTGKNSDIMETNGNSQQTVEIINNAVNSHYRDEHSQTFSQSESVTKSHNETFQSGINDGCVFKDSIVRETSEHGEAAETGVISSNSFKETHEISEMKRNMHSMEITSNIEEHSMKTESSKKISSFETSQEYSENCDINTMETAKDEYEANSKVISINGEQHIEKSNNEMKTSKSSKKNKKNRKSSEVSKVVETDSSTLKQKEENLKTQNLCNIESNKISHSFEKSESILPNPTNDLNLSDKSLGCHYESTSNQAKDTKKSSKKNKKDKTVKHQQKSLDDQSAASSELPEKTSMEQNTTRSNFSEMKRQESLDSHKSQISSSETSSLKSEKQEKHKKDDSWTEIDQAYEGSLPSSFESHSESHSRKSSKKSSKKNKKTNLTPSKENQRTRVEEDIDLINRTSQHRSDNIEEVFSINEKASRKISILGQTYVNEESNIDQEEISERVKSIKKESTGFLSDQEREELEKENGLVKAIREFHAQSSNESAEDQNDENVQYTELERKMIEKSKIAQETVKTALEDIEKSPRSERHNNQPNQEAMRVQKHSLSIQDGVLIEQTTTEKFVNLTDGAEEIAETCTIDPDSLKNVDGPTKQRKGSSRFSKRQGSKSKSPGFGNRSSFSGPDDHEEEEEGKCVKN